jgi:hypothetical protein
MPGRGGREPHPDKVLQPGERWLNVTVRLVVPRDEAALKVCMARFGVSSYGAAARCAIREAADMKQEGECRSE